MCRINIAIEQLLSHNFLKLELQPKVQTQHEHLELLLHFPTLAKFKLHQNKFKSSEYLQGMFCGTIHHWMRNSCEIKQKIVFFIYSSNIIFTRLPKMPAFCAFHCLKNSLDILNAWGLSRQNLPFCPKMLVTTCNKICLSLCSTCWKISTLIAIKFTHLSQDTANHHNLSLFPFNHMWKNCFGQRDGTKNI